MKKTFLAITALAAMLFAGCTSSDELTTLESIKTADNTPTPVQFGTYIGKTTRSGVSGDIDAHATASTLAAKGGFGVFAYYTGASNYAGTTAPNFMYNEAVTSTDNGSTWTYSPVKYWPNQYGTGNVDNKQGSNESDNAQSASELGKVSFFAYGPYVSVADPAVGTAAATTYGITGLTTNAATTHPKVTYKLAKGQQASEGVDFVDLLWGVKTNAAPDTYNTDLTKNNAGLTSANKDGKVKFIFKHALTKVGGDNAIKAVLDIDGNGTGGDAGYGSKDATTLVTINSINIKDVEDNFVTDGDFDLATGTWEAGLADNTGDGNNIDLSFNPTGSSAIKIAGALAEPTSPPTWDGSAWSITGVTTTATNVYDGSVDAAGKKALYFIPSSANAQKLKVTIQYTVRTYDAKLAAPSGETAACSKVTQTISNIVTLPTTLIKSNKKITLVLHLGLTSVKFAAQVSDWDTPVASDIREVWLPSNVE